MKLKFIILLIISCFTNLVIAQLVDSQSDKTANVLKSNSTLTTMTGNEIGLSVSNYSYWEPSLSVNLYGILFGINYERTQAFEDFFLLGDFKYEQGSLAYNSGGTGSQNGVKNYYYEIRGLIGKDFEYDNFVIAPFTGIGYRDLYTDIRGTSSSGAAGYRREISYWYLPFGGIHRINVADGKLETRLEWDYLISGTVNSYLSDAIGYNGITFLPDAKNTQKSGWGIKFSTSYQINSWAFTPYINYWSIQNSDVVYGSATIKGVTNQIWLKEPTNTTTELGFKASYKF
jgi:hypothetical protein